MARSVTRAGIYDVVPHLYSQQDADKIVAGYPDFERKARAYGVPVMGSGRVFPLNEDQIKVEAFEIPSHWAQVAGIDFGWEHPTAAVRLAHDRDADKVFVVDSYKASHQTPVIHGAALKAWGDWLPWAWPHDGIGHEKSGGAPLKEQYRAQGLNMLAQHASYDGKDGNAVEPGIAEMLDWMQTGRLKVFAHLRDWLDEFNLYHRKDGVIVKLGDDLMSATRYAFMMRRFATTKMRRKQGTRQAYNPLDYARDRPARGSGYDPLR